MNEEFIYCSKDKDNPILFVELAGTSFCDGSYSIKRKKSDVYVMELVLEGTGTIIHDGKKYTASKGDFYLLKKGDDHYYFSSPKKPWTKIWLNLRGKLMDYLLEIYSMNQIVYSAPPALLVMFKEFHHILNSNLETNDFHQKCENLLHNIISTVYFTTQVPLYAIHEDAVRVKAYLEQHILDSISLADLSNILYKSEAQIIRTFKQSYQMTPYAYFLTIKLQYAKTLLIHTNMTIKEISSHLSFADEHYFSNIFKKYEHTAPSIYRSQHHSRQ